MHRFSTSIDPEVTYVSPKGNVVEKFEGDWMNGKMHGHGKYQSVASLEYLHRYHVLGRSSEPDQSENRRAEYGRCLDAVSGTPTVEFTKVIGSTGRCTTDSCGASCVLS